jgi:hypothetical protein
VNDPDLQALERRLRTLPPLLSVPPDLVDRSMATGVAGRAWRSSISEARRRPLRLPRRWAVAGGSAAACLMLTLAAVLVVAVGGNTRYSRIANLSGAGHASGYVAVGPADGTTEPVIVSVAHLRPASPGSYYEISFQTQGKPVPGAVFNVGANGSAVVHLNAPAHTRWVRCWVTRRSVGGSTPGTVVMSAATRNA